MLFMSALYILPKDSLHLWLNASIRCKNQDAAYIKANVHVKVSAYFIVSLRNSEDIHSDCLYLSQRAVFK